MRSTAAPVDNPIPGLTMFVPREAAFSSREQIMARRSDVGDSADSLTRWQSWRGYSRADTFGVGQAVLSFLEAEAENAGYRCMLVGAPLLNSKSLAFFVRNGYMLSGAPKMGRGQQ